MSVLMLLPAQVRYFSAGMLVLAPQKKLTWLLLIPIPSMQIKTTEITITPNKLFIIAVRRHFKEKKWLLLAYPVGLFGYIFLMSLSFGRFRYLGIIGFGLMLAVLLYILAYYWEKTHSPKNKRTFLARTYEFDPFYIRTRVADGAEAVYRWDQITKVEVYPTYYLLYTSPIHFMYIEKKAFQHQDDRRQFERLLKERGLQASTKA